MKHIYKPNQIGSFITFEIWEDAFKLLQFQIEQMKVDKKKKGNRHFNTFSLFYYRRLKDREKVGEQDYFRNRVANNLLYGLTDEYAILPYLLPKAGLGLRQYKFFTYPMRVLYYSFGIYLLQLCDEFLTQYVSSHKHIKSFYGGNLKIESNRLKVSGYDIYYRQRYKSFRRLIKNESKGEIKDKIIISIDIQNYFDDISISTLLNLLQEYIKPGIQQSFNFTPSTIEEINSFFTYLANAQYGIPQSDNDIISSFIAHLYLVFGDLFIDDEIQRIRNSLESYKIIRYVDDIYISLTFKENVTERVRQSIINSFGARIADLLYHRLHLRLNPKTRFYWLGREADKKEFLDSLIKVSPRYAIPNDSKDDDEETPEGKIERIFTELSNLKNTELGKFFDYDKSAQEEAFREVYDDRVEQLLQKKENAKRIQKIFTDFNFDFVKASPREIIIIILKDKITYGNFRQYLLQLDFVATKDADLIINLLCQTGFEDDELYKKLSDNLAMQDIIALFEKSEIPFEYPGYHGLCMSQIDRLCNLSHVIEQIQLRAISSRTRNYSVALNHLLNELHAICYDQDARKKKSTDYKADDVVSFLNSMRVPHEYCVKVRNLFDRRNKNQVSHPGSAEQVSWAVDEKEYWMYFDSLSKCLTHIL